MHTKYKIPNTEYRGKKVVIMGLGLHGGGVGAAKFFARRGAKVLVTDLKDAKYLAVSVEKLKGLPIVYALGGHRFEDFRNADLIVKGPGVTHSSPYLEVARSNSIPIDTDIGIFFELAEAPIVGITGSKGKSTTAYLASRMLAQKFKDRVVLAGNIRTSVFDVLPKIRKNGVIVLELSSFELEGLKSHRKSPKVALITNILRDHQDRYPNLAEYIEAKKLIFRFQKPADILFLNADDKIARSFAKDNSSRTIFFSRRIMNGKKFRFLRDAVKSFPDHVRQNIIAAANIALLFKVPKKSILKALKSFRGLEGRGEVVAEINGVKFVNDTCATIPEAAVSAVKSLKRHKIILICGGADKNLDFGEFAKFIPGRIKSLVLLPGSATQKIKEELARSKSSASPIEVFSMAGAVKAAVELASRGDTVLLSPGAASFGLFKNEFDRGGQFKKYVVELRKNSGSVRAKKRFAAKL